MCALEPEGGSISTPFSSLVASQNGGPPREHHSSGRQGAVSVLSQTTPRSGGWLDARGHDQATVASAVVEQPPIVSSALVASTEYRRTPTVGS